MTKLPVVTGRQAVRAFERVGYEAVRQKGSHIRMRNRRNSAAKPLTIPDHREIKAGLLLRLIKDADLTVDAFLKLLND